jgi:hypothetical protein
VEPPGRASPPTEPPVFDQRELVAGGPRGARPLVAGSSAYDPRLSRNDPRPPPRLLSYGVRRESSLLLGLPADRLSLLYEPVSRPPRSVYDPRDPLEGGGAEFPPP